MIRLFMNCKKLIVASRNNLFYLFSVNKKVALTGFHLYHCCHRFVTMQYYVHNNCLTAVSTKYRKMLHKMYHVLTAVVT